MNTSYSALDTFKSCPLKYKFQEIDKLKTPKAPEAVFGTLVHSTLKFIHDGGFILPTQKEALNYFSSNWNTEIFEDETQERMAFAQGIKIIQDYFKKNDPSKAQIVDLESRFTIELSDENEKHLISGFIDRIDKTEDGFEVIDYKTNRKLPAQSYIDENMQLFIYLLALIKRYPQLEQNPQVVKLSLYFLKHGVKLSTIKTSELIEQGRQKLLDIIHEVQKSDFPPCVSPLCQWCGFQQHCPMWKHKFKNKEPLDINEQERQSLISEYIKLNEGIKMEKKKLMEIQSTIIAIMEQEKSERLFTEGSIVAKSYRKTYKYDEVKLKDILITQGLWENVLKLDATKLKKVMETLPSSVKKEIEALKELQKESFTLSIKKEKEALTLEE